MSFERYHKNLLLSRLANEPRRFIEVIYGPRQVGKTTLIRQIMGVLAFPVVYASADHIASDQKTWVAVRWEEARLKIKQEKSTEGLLVLDEIQKLDN